jgi:methyl-accepting chemotaxis protein WspA
MDNKTTPFFIQHLSKFTYPQKFLFTCIFFGFAVCISSYFLVRTQYRDIVTVRHEIETVAYQKELNKLLEKIVYHEISMHEYIAGNTSLKKEILDQQAEIKSQFQIVESFDATFKMEDLFQSTNPTISSIKPLSHRWKNITTSIWEKSTEQNMQLHYMLVKDLLSHSIDLTENSLLVLAADIDTFYLASLLIDLLPQAELDIPQVIILSEMLDQNKSTHRDIGIKLASFSFILNANLEKTKQAYAIVKKYDNPVEQVIKAFTDYATSIQELTQVIYDDIVEPLEIQKPIVPIENLGTKALSATFALWYKTSDVTKSMLTEKLTAIKQELFSTLAMTISGSILGLLFGFIIMKQISAPLIRLISASRKLAEGDLSVRVPVNTQDEVGQVSEAFNQMVESLQELIGRLQWTGIQLTTSTTEISAAAKQQESSVVEQEATTKQIAVTAKEIASTAKDFARTMSDVSITAEQTSALASAGREGLGQMEGIMGQMVDASKNIASKLAVLSEKAGNITSVITTITKVADQTNLLSLNAAIEAEKAGEHGRSFSVIAKEIRRLADQTANATLDIEKMVNEIVSAISAGVMGVDKFSEVIYSGVGQASQVGGQLTKIIEQVQQLTKNFETVNQGMQAQSLSAEQITESINQLSDTARQTTESILHFHKAIEELNNAAQEMQSAVSRIKR